MNWQATSPNLPIEFAKIEHIVGSYQDKQNPPLTQVVNKVKSEQVLR